MSFRDDVIAPLINDMMSGVGDLNLFGMSLSDVLQAPSEVSWGADADSGIKAMAAATVSPVASVVLVTLAYVELNRTLALSEADGESRFRQSLVTVLKILLCIVLLEWAPQVLEAILQVTADMASDANAAMQTALADKTKDGSDNISAFLDSIDNLDWIGQAVLVIILLFAWLINKAAVLIALGVDRDSFREADDLHRVLADCCVFHGVKRYPVLGVGVFEEVHFGCSSGVRDGAGIRVVSDDFVELWDQQADLGWR